MQRHPHVCEPRNLYLAECSECEILEQAIEDLDTKVEKYNKEIRNTLSNHDTRITANKTAIDKLRTDLDTCCAEVKATLANHDNEIANLKTTKQDKMNATAPIAITGVTISHNDSGVTAGSKGDTTNQTPAFGGTFKVTSETVDAKGHTTALAEHTVKIPDTLATTTTAGLMNSGDKSKLNGIATGAEVNQNAFSNVKVGSTTVAADTKTDTLELVGSNVTLTPDATNDKITIGITKANVVAALGYTPPTQDTNTTYTAGTGLTLNGTTFNHTNSVSALTSESLRKIKYDAQGHITGSSAVTKADITALGIPGENTSYTAGANISINNGVISATDTNTTYSAGNGLSLSGTTFSLNNTAISGSSGDWNISGDTGSGDFSNYQYKDLWTAPSAGIVICSHQLSFLDELEGLRNSGITLNSGIVPATIMMQRKMTSGNVINNSACAFIVSSGSKVGVRVAQRNPSGATVRCRAYINGIFIAY